MREVVLRNPAHLATVYQGGTVISVLYPGGTRFALCGNYGKDGVRLTYFGENEDASPATVIVSQSRFNKRFRDIGEGGNDELRRELVKLKRNAKSGWSGK